MTDESTSQSFNHSINLQYEDKIYKLEFNQKNNNLIITCTDDNSFSKFGGVFSKNSLEKLSRFFLLFDSIEESFPELISKLEKKEFSISVTEELFQLTFKINIMNCKDFTLEKKKKKEDLSSSVQSLCTTVIQLKDENKKLEKVNSEFRNEIITLKSEIENLKSDIKLIKDTLFPIKEEDKYKEILSESKIIKSIEEKKLIMDWIKPNTEIKFNLLYQVSRDGDRISNFYSKVSNKFPTIVIVKSAIGNKFGGFTNEKWEKNTNYKKDESAFLFSITKKKKYEINNVECAIYGSSKNFAFGNGHDLSISDKCKSAYDSNYSYFPFAYTSDEKNGLTCGEYNFYVNECEVYHVEILNG